MTTHKFYSLPRAKRELIKKVWSGLVEEDAFHAFSIRISIGAHEGLPREPIRELIQEGILVLSNERSDAYSGTSWRRLYKISEQWTLGAIRP